MSVQYISDSKGKTTGVFIPVREWEKLKEKYEGLEETAEAMPEWHKRIVRDRLAEYKANRHIAVPFEEALTALENE
ncbi:addiction module protein [Parapedobacter sp. 10938]|uniref:addiction module protein n=1 Tax=Parapedobacter flavus TaxID=3110225 RepID=UPI002DBA09A0|nr:addiction module protein [Parapedobacter sp. 10938]MEC3881426.1 addiction module protein [Parapedobacter sp. 10938]